MESWYLREICFSSPLPSSPLPFPPLLSHPLPPFSMTLYLLLHWKDQSHLTWSPSMSQKPLHQEMSLPSPGTLSYLKRKAKSSLKCCVHARTYACPVPCLFRPSPLRWFSPSLLSVRGPLSALLLLFSWLSCPGLSWPKIKVSHPYCVLHIPICRFRWASWQKGLHSSRVLYHLLLILFPPPQSPHWKHFPPMLPKNSFLSAKTNFLLSSH